jgi:hypothetical protein
MAAGGRTEPLANPTRLGIEVPHSMRRLIPLVIALATLAAFAGPVAAQGPERFPNEPVTLGPDVFAGTCAFPVQLVDTFAAGNTKLFPVDENGDQRMLSTGGYRSTLTNLATGESIDIKYFGRLDYVFRADGTVDLSVSGGSLNWFTAGDALSTLGQGIWLVHGHVTARLDAETFFVLEPERVTGNVMDICAALS